MTDHVVTSDRFIVGRIIEGKCPEHNVPLTPCPECESKGLCLKCITPYGGENLHWWVADNIAYSCCKHHGHRDKGRAAWDLNGKHRAVDSAI